MNGGLVDSPFVSRDGQRMYFQYSRYNGFTHVLDGPMRPGHNTSANWFDDVDLYRAHRNADGTWGRIENLGFNTNLTHACPCEVQGPPHKLYYIRDGAGTQLSDVCSRTETGTTNVWSAETVEGMNTTANDFNPHVNPTDDFMIFSSDLGGGTGGRDLYGSSKSVGVWGVPATLGAVYNTTFDDDQPWATTDLGTIYFNRGDASGTRIWKSVGGAAATLVNLGFVSVGDWSMPDSQLEAFFVVADLVRQKLIVHRADTDGSGGWTNIRPVDFP